MCHDASSLAPSITPPLRGVIAYLAACHGREVMLELSPQGLACDGRDVIILSLVEMGLLKVTPYGEDPMRARHLELQIGVVGDGLELGVAWPA